MIAQELIKTLMEELQGIAKTDTVIGEPIKVDEVSILPISKISVGFGAGGGGDGKGEGGGGSGGGVLIEPVALIVISKGKAQIIPIKGKGISLGKLVEIAPEIAVKLKKILSKEDDKGKKGKGEGG